MNTKKIIPLLILAVAIVLMVNGGSRDWILDQAGRAYNAIFGQPRALEAGYYYTCPMHPQIRLFGPGQCPICGMDLVKVKQGEEARTGNIQFTAQQIQQGGIRSERIQKRVLVKIVEAAGKIDYDERSLSHVAARIDGRIDKLYTDFTGMEILKGHSMVWLYSPQLVSGQQEFFSALATYDTIKKNSSSPESVNSAAELVESARRRLLLWGIDENQVAEMEKTRSIVDHITINAPIGGTIIKKNVLQGMYVKEGDTLFEIADLSTVWLYADIYEQDIPLIMQSFDDDYYQCPMHPEVKQAEKGNCHICNMPLIRHSPSLKAEITSQAFPGESFNGAIEFTFPFVNPATRTLRIRISIPNPDKKLRPEMYARAQIWIERPAITAIPESAVTFSGKRNIVFIDQGQGKFKPALVSLGAMWLYDKNYAPSEQKALPFHTGMQRYHELLGGVEEGELIVTSGNFLIDAESQLQGAMNKLLSQETTESRTDTETSNAICAYDGMEMPIASFQANTVLNDNKLYFCTEDEKNIFLKSPNNSYMAFRNSFNDSVNGLLEEYARLGKMLAENSEHTMHTIAGLSKALDKSAGMNPSELPIMPPVKEKFTALRKQFLKHREEFDSAKDPADARKAFDGLSTTLIDYLKPLNGRPAVTQYFLFFCPMVKKYWIQDTGETMNPYDPNMKSCGEVKEWGK